MGKMEDAAAAQMGEPVLAGADIATPGVIVRAGVSAGIGGAIGVGIAMGAERLARGAQIKDATTPEGYKGLMCIAAGPTKLAFFEYKRGLLRNSGGRLLVAVPRSSVAAFEFGCGTLATMFSVLLCDGTHYALEVARARKGKAETVRQRLNLQQSDG